LNEIGPGNGPNPPRHHVWRRWRKKLLPGGKGSGSGSAKKLLLFPDREVDAVESGSARQAGGGRRALLALEYPGIEEIDDASLEWRRLFSELLGTFFLVLVAAGGAVVTAKSNGAISRSTAVAAPGLMVTAIILFMGAISGAHLNPAVTLAFAARRDFPWRRVPGYILIQLIGATLACLFLWAVLGNLGGLGATEPGAGTTDWRAMLIELILTVGLVSTILGTASRAQNVGALSAVAVGGYIIVAGFWASPISGASMNPARSFGPDLANRDFANYWVYLLGPITGALIAVTFAYVLRGPGGDIGGTAAAQGSLDQLAHDATAEPGKPHQRRLDD
jgi:aquaporin Z